MSVREAVGILTELMRDGGATLARRHGPEAVTVAQDMRTFLESQLEDLMPYDSLWEDFRAAPVSMSAELMGALEALIEADSALAQGLDQFLQEYRQVIGPPEARTLGSLEQGPVESIPATTPMEQREQEGEGGEYLYGNVLSDEVELGLEVQDEERELGLPTEVEMVSLDPAEVTWLFDPVYDVVRADRQLNATEKMNLESELRMLEGEIVRGDGANEEQLVEHLRHLEREAPDLFNILMARLTAYEGNLGSTVERVLDNI